VPPGRLRRCLVCARRLGERRCRMHGSRYRSPACATVGRVFASSSNAVGAETRNVCPSGACGQTPRKRRCARRPYAPQPGAASLLCPQSTMMSTCRPNCGS
jgi:hypothetical protein